MRETGAALTYFDIKAFLKADTGRLNHSAPLVLKTVVHNGIQETKKVKIADWGQELSLFAESDINRPTWKNSYTIIDNDEFLIYEAKSLELRTREILIKRERGKIKWILISNRTKNTLYQTYEKLTYYPDSLYLIEKRQHIRLMGNNSYMIKGVIKY
jgi:hypothetical protein